ncbi:cyclin-dependent kinase inhibitor far1 [Mortierella sp. AD094]|nr:cyclin-dependent kinase inhibitor far1 [Mortierella sp. AD094]
MSSVHSNDPLHAMDFYTKNNVIFITGGTGFIGKVVLEKILRSLPQVKKIYLLIRASEKNPLQSRLDKDVFGSRLFEPLKAQYGNDEQRFRQEVTSKVVPVQGDIGQKRLGLSDDDYRMIQKDTAVIINAAASVKFNNPLMLSIALNTEGPFQVFELAKGMLHLKSLVQVSTAYANEPLAKARIKEDIYHQNIENPEQLYEKLLKMSDKEIEVFEKEVVGVHGSTYIFAKLFAELLINSRYKALSLPLVLIRPATVTSAAQEPIPGWSEGLSAIIGCSTACGLGKVQEWAANENMVTDMIPVDIVSKTLLMAAVGIASGLPEPMTTVPIVHSGSSTICPVTNGMIFSYFEQYWKAVPAPRGRVSNDIRVDFYNTEAFPLLVRQKFSKEIALAETEGGSEYKKMLKISVGFPTAFSKILSSEWIFEGYNSLMLDKLAPKELRSGLGDGIDWPTYLHIFNMGVHEFILGEKVDKSIVINYKTRPLHKEFVPTLDS